jgi:hypothetical protein
MSDISEMAVPISTLRQTFRKRGRTAAKCRLFALAEQLPTSALKGRHLYRKLYLVLLHKLRVATLKNYFIQHSVNRIREADAQPVRAGVRLSSFLRCGT